MVRCALVMVAGGSGQRLGANQPKALVELGGQALYAWSWQRFAACQAVSEAVLVLPHDHVDAVSQSHPVSWNQGFDKVQMVSGGDSRTASMLRGVRALGDEVSHVLVHDAARPLVGLSDIEALAQLATQCQAAFLAAPVHDTIVEVEGDVIKQGLDRSQLRAALTPQLISRSLALEAEKLWQAKNNPVLTDDMALAALAGVSGQVLLAQAGHHFKITTSEDLKRAEKLLESLALAPPGAQG